MPYIKRERRLDFRWFLCDSPKYIRNKGELEYVLYQIAVKYLFMDDQPNFDRRHDVVYAIQHVADELRRRHLDGYEDEKIKDNGDIF